MSDVQRTHFADDETIAHIAKLEDEIARLKSRLEISPDHGYDGIACRDETIRLQDEEIARLKALAEGMALAWSALTLMTANQRTQWKNLYSPTVKPTRRSRRHER